MTKNIDLPPRVTFPITKRVAFAKALTRRSAEMKDWQIRNKKNKKMREIARQLVQKNGGYIIAYPSEISEKYGGYHGNNNRKLIWCIHWNSMWKELQFTAI